ncbi:J domain-containing protein [Pendulispora rubella]|uniref:J domain-containing protein n=1 Tax=Pendulispora rubella TaxID=2741070 RepID=A0ABZ2KP02_9BACT
MSQLFAPLCSITKTKRRRFFWAVWSSGPPTHVPFRKPDAEDGGASTREEALAAAEKKVGTTLTEIDPLWARAWIRIIRGQEPWPTKASREPIGARTKPERSTSGETSIWELLGVPRDATEADLKAAYRKRVLETHPDHGGDDETFRRIVSAYSEAQRRLRKPRRKAKA